MSMFDLQFDPREIEWWSSRYRYYMPDSEMQQIGTAVKQRGHISRDEFLSICRWKSPRTRKRCQSNSEDCVREATRIALSAQSEHLRIGILTLLNGVRWPTASTILHFCHSDPYPILDYRALWSFGVDKPPNEYGFEFWWEYVKACRRLAYESKVTMRELDRALWQYSKEHQVKPAQKE